MYSAGIWSRLCCLQESRDTLRDATCTNPIRSWGVGGGVGGGMAGESWPEKEEGRQVGPVPVPVPVLVPV